MMFPFPLFITIYAGFIHAFETDHMLAVSNIVTRREKLYLALKDGMFWGFGHTSTIFIIGLLMILFKMNIRTEYFNYVEATVGAMLISLGLYRLVKLVQEKKLLLHSHGHMHDGVLHHKHIHAHIGNKDLHEHSHSLAYGVGLIHGLAGSGALVLMVMLQVDDPMNGLLYLLVFGAGSILGMLVVAGLFSFPFSKKLMQAHSLQVFLIIISSLLCLVYGGKVIYENLG